MKRTFENYMCEEILDVDIIGYWNEYCELNCYFDKIIHHMNYFSDIVGNSFIDIFPRLDTKFTLKDAYFTYQDKISSYSTEEAVNRVCISEMEEFMLEHHNDVLTDWLEEED